MPERNAKVRRRLAAGKLHLRICDLRNLGPRAEDILATVGIRTAKELRERGALEAYLELRRRGSMKTLNMLWALVGALDPWPEGTDWREVSRSEARLPLMLEVEARDQARIAVRKAAGLDAPTTPSLDSDTDGAREEWVPGMPFEPQKKNRP